jgi:hypothetical protein
VPREGRIASEISLAELMESLTAHRTMALQECLAARPDVALMAVAHALALRVFYRPGRYLPWAGGEGCGAGHVCSRHSKDPMIEHAERLLSGKRWLPAVLRNIAAEVPASA